ncbi:MAG: hypothetical protein JWO60_554, partial [Frankiales bacterium]|nr:hypothetical protein [Frankiales bacterium]
MDLTSQMRSPSLGLEPAPDLADVVRRRAGRVRTRRRAAIGAVGAAAVLGAA